MCDKCQRDEGRCCRSNIDVVAPRDIIQLNVANFKRKNDGYYHSQDWIVRIFVFVLEHFVPFHSYDSFPLDNQICCSSDCRNAHPITMQHLYIAALR